MSLLKTLQQVTRVMNHLCGHSKYEKDRNLLKFVPKLRRTLEAFVCQVGSRSFDVEDGCCRVERGGFVFTHVFGLWREELNVN